ncbi:MAG: lactonase family protein [Lachnospiraceae bacterium]|jgi:6-phosphogluconolactonase|nr:lactonase family protein [Lachnospiraceae bacterium]
MEKNNSRYVAYISTYTSGSKDKCGIKIYDVDLEKGRFHDKGEVEINNSSYLTISHNRNFLYSITDTGVEAHRILADGMLESIGGGSINGMRGCYLSTDYDDQFLFVAGYHDGKLTVLRINEDGSVGEIVEEIYHKGPGSAAERYNRPHITCARMSRDNKFLCEADSGLDRVNIYELNHTTGKLKLADIIRSEQSSAPRHCLFSRDGNYLYVVHELKKFVGVYKYTHSPTLVPDFELIETIPTVNKYHATGTTASALKMSYDGSYLVSSNAGDNSVILYDVDKESGKLTKSFCLPISGDYPKAASLFPDNRHLVSLNHETKTLTFFKVDMENHQMAMSGREMKIDRPNCIIFHRLAED